jgi:hypothetical protein
MEQIKLKNLFEGILKAPSNSDMDALVENWNIIESIKSCEDVNGNTIWHVMAKWNDMNWFFFDMAARSSSKKKTQSDFNCVLERFLTKKYKLGDEFVKNKEGKTPEILCKENMEFEFYLSDWWWSVRKQIEDDKLRSLCSQIPSEVKTSL